jgi:phage portal protein BeeE
MGIMRALRLTGAVMDPPVSRAALEASAATVTHGIRSPWVTGSLTPLVWRDIFGAGDAGPVARDQAMRVPALVRAVSLVTSTLARCPWVEYQGEVEVTDQPAWLYATDGPIAPQYRAQFVAEDLILGGWCVLQVERDSDGNILSAVRVRPDLWQFDDVGNVVIDDKTMDPSEVIVIKGPHDGLLITGADALRGAINLERAWQRVVRNPLPFTVIKQTNDDILDDDEIDDLLKAWRDARQDPDGAVAYLPNGLDVQGLGQIIADVLVEARNASAVDIARLVGVPAVSIDAGPVESSLTYSNQETANGQTLPLYGIAPYADAIAAALSMDSVCPPGHRIAPDMTQVLNDAASLSRSGTPVKD